MCFLFFRWISSLKSDFVRGFLLNSNRNNDQNPIGLHAPHIYHSDFAVALRSVSSRSIGYILMDFVDIYR